MEIFAIPIELVKKFTFNSKISYSVLFKTSNYYKIREGVVSFTSACQLWDLTRQAVLKNHQN